MADPAADLRPRAERGSAQARVVVSEAADPGRDESISLLFHELRTPLASLLGFTDLLLEREYSPEKRRELLGIVRDEGRRLSGLIENFLDLQRIESGRQEYNFERCDPAPLLRAWAADFERAGEGHTFSVDVPERLPPVVVDSERLRRLISNLLSNAQKYSPDGGRIRLAARAEEKRVLVCVADEGIGIAPEEMPLLFTRFFRGERAVRRGIRGSGLGLALCRAIVRRLRGELWVDSEPGRGSVFYVALPLAPAEETPSPAPPNVFR